MSDERKHCEAVVDDFGNGGLGAPEADSREQWWFSRGELADLIARERAAARAEVLEEVEHVLRVKVSKPMLDQLTAAIRAFSNRET